MTVAFTEPQIYHLLRVLTDEVINMPCSAMEEMMIGAVKGTPATAPSRTEQFRAKTRAPVHKHRQVGDSSSEGFTTGRESGSETFGNVSMLQGDEDLPLPDESDSSGEMELIAGTFKRTATVYPDTTQQCHSRQDSPGEEAESTGLSSLDATLSEVRDQLHTRKSRHSTQAKRTTKAKRMWGAHARRVLLENWLDSLFHIKASGSFAQPTYGLVPYVQKELFREDERDS